MKKYPLILRTLTAGVLLAFNFACTESDDVPGSGEGQLGFALKLNGITQIDSRVAFQGISIQEGFVQIKKLEMELEGRNDSGEFEKEYEVSFDEIKKITLDRFNSEEDFIINIPEGEYKEIEVELDLIDHDNEPSIFLTGTYMDAEGNSVPMRFEHFGDDIDFEIEIEAEDDDSYFTIDRVNNPLAILEIFADNWFTNVTNLEWENADRTEGAIVISNDSNREIYNKVKSRIEESVDIEIELED